MASSTNQKIFTVGLKGLRCFAYHGVFPQENKVGNEFIVDFSVSYIPDSPIADNLESSISYADLHDIVTSEMAIPSKLLETVAERIAAATLEHWPHITSGEIVIEKITPPIPSITGSAYVKYTF